jgi:hypothetical protein
MSALLMPLETVHKPHKPIRKPNGCRSEAERLEVLTCFVGEDDATELSSFPLKPGTAGAEPAGLQPGQLVAAAGVAQGNRELVANQLAATTGEDGWTAGKTCALLLATAGGRASEPAAVQSDAGPDRAATDTDGMVDRGPVGSGIRL